PLYGGPHLGEEGAVLREAEALHHGEDELAVAVVLGEPVRAVVIDDARDVPVGALMGRIPAHELAGRGALSDPEKGRRHDRAVADPRPRISSRSGLQR